MKIGTYIKQHKGFMAFTPDIFPPKEGFNFSDILNKKNSEASSPNSSIQFSLLRENTKLNTLAQPKKINNKSKDGFIIFFFF